MLCMEKLSQSQKVDSDDLRWLYSHPGRCHICGCAIIEGDQFQAGNMMQTYPVGEARLVRQQWHLECAEGVYQQ